MEPYVDKIKHTIGGRYISWESYQDMIDWSQLTEQEKYDSFEAFRIRFGYDYITNPYSNKEK